MTGGSVVQKPAIILFGGGNFALGGVLGGAHDSANFDVYLFVPTPHTSPSLEVVPCLRDYREFVVTAPSGDVIAAIAGVEFSDTPNGRQRLRALLADANTYAVLSSVGDKQPAVIDLISASLPGGRGESLPPLVYIPCENDIYHRWFGVGDGANHSRHGVALYTMVDRICASRWANDRCAYVAVEDYRELLVEDPARLKLDDSTRRRLVEVLAGFDMRACDDIEKAHNRKIVMMNGLQMSVAALAHDAGLPLDATTQDFFNLTGAQLVHEMAQEFGIYLVELGFVEAAALRWSELYANRVLATEDRLRRLLRRVIGGTRDEALNAIHIRVGRALKSIVKELGEDSHVGKAKLALMRIVENPPGDDD